VTKRSREDLINYYKARTDNGSEVAYTSEFQRILSLPMRDWEKHMQDTSLHLKMTTAFRQPRGTQVLRPIQAAAIAELHDLKGLLAPIGVGVGKTHITFLAPLVLNVSRPILLVPASLKEKTYREFAALRMHWVGHPSLRVESYEMISTVGGQDILNNYMPDMIICDECHRLKNKHAAVTRRVLRYMKDNPDTIFAGMSGSIMKRSIMDFWHLAYLALRHRMPLPRDESEAEDWGSVLDEHKDVVLGHISRKKPGALVLLCEDLDENDTIDPVASVFSFAVEDTKKERVRLGFQKRFRSTPGIVCSGAEELDCSLTIERLDWPMGPKSKAAVEKLKTTGYTPVGDLISEPSLVWLMTLELASGFYYRLDPPAPHDWLTARREWNASVRLILEKHLPGLDSPLQVQQALTHGKYVDRVAWAAYQDWSNIRDTFEPNQVVEWLDQDIMLRCADWMRRTKGIAWVYFNACGEHLSKISGVGYCGEQGVDSSGKMMESYEGGSVIASITANSTGRNLQAWNESLVVTPPSNALAWEQLLGRTHRQLQKADNVTYSWINSCAEHESAFRQSISDARAISTITASSRQRILYADHVGFVRD